VIKTLLSITAIAATGVFYAAAQQNDAPLPPDAAAQKQLLDDVRAKAFDFEKYMPDFVCNQVSHHSLDPQGRSQWKTLETASEQLRFTNHAAEYTLLAENGKKASGGEKRPSWVISIDEFTTLLHQIFDPSSKAEMIWTNWDSVRGHRVHMITFAVRKQNSTWRVGGAKGIVSGFAGFAYVDADTLGIVRILLAANDIPAKYPIQGVSEDLSYEFTRVGDKVYLLPLKADLRHKEALKQIWDEVEFKDFKKQ
jgi:hypothetical protein